jgi:hypothetical protein
MHIKRENLGRLSEVCLFSPLFQYISGVKLSFGERKLEYPSHGPCSGE